MLSQGKIKVNCDYIGRHPGHKRPRRAGGGKLQPIRRECCFLRTSISERPARILLLRAPVMNSVQWATAIAVTIFLLEGFVLSVFPAQFKEMLAQADPRSLQIAGAAETLVAVCLLAGLLVG